METRDIDEIVLARIAAQKLTQQENELFDRWYAADDNSLRFNDMLRARAAIIASRAAGVDTAGAWRRIDPPVSKPSTVRRLLRYAAVVAVPLCLGLGLWQYLSRGPLDGDSVVKPGEGMAVLTTYDGRELIFSQTTETAFDEHGRVMADDAPDGAVATAAEAGAAGEIPGGLTNSIEIPRGGFFKVVLGDGTTVWLNSQSKMKFPPRFDGDQRRVTIDGEAYFQVAKDSDKPFIVQTRDYEIRVTGTEFNVKSYEPGATATTLVEGSVEIELDGRVSRLSPNQQATLSDGAIAVREVNVERYVAWQQGAFSYSQTSLGEIMDELARWYDIEVVWSDEDARYYHFSAWFDRQSDIGEIIEVLEKTNRVEMTLRGRTLTIRDK